jgi:hypothetical protein
MSTISQTPGIKTTRLFDNQIQFLLGAAAVIAMLAAIFINMVSRDAASLGANAYRLYRQGEWVSVPFTPEQAYQVFRLGEVASSSTEAYQIYRQGEWASNSASSYLSTYQLSERTRVDPQAGLALYLNSERTSVPVRFTPYQLSEWFSQ